MWERFGGNLRLTGDEALFSIVFRALIVFYSGCNIETCKISEATFLTLHFLPYARFFAGKRGGGHDPSGPMIKYASEGVFMITLLFFRYYIQHNVF